MGQLGNEVRCWGAVPGVPMNSMQGMRAPVRLVIALALLSLNAGCLVEHVPPASKGSLWYCAEDREKTTERLNQLAKEIDATFTSPTRAPGEESDTYYFRDIHDGQMALNIFMRRDSLVYHYYRRNHEDPDQVARRVLELKRLFAGDPGGCPTRTLR